MKVNYRRGDADVAFLRKFYGFRGKRKNNSFDGQKILFFDEGEGRERNLFQKRKKRVKKFFLPLGEVKTKKSPTVVGGKGYCARKAKADATSAQMP